MFLYVYMCHFYCRSGVALAMRHRLCGLSTYGLNGLEREMSTPPTLRRGTANFTLPLLLLWSAVGALLVPSCAVLLLVERSLGLSLNVFSNNQNGDGDGDETK